MFDVIFHLAHLHKCSTSSDVLYCAVNMKKKKKIFELCQKKDDCRAVCQPGGWEV